MLKLANDVAGSQEFKELGAGGKSGSKDTNLDLSQVKNAGIPYKMLFL